MSLVKEDGIQSVQTAESPDVNLRSIVTCDAATSAQHCNLLGPCTSKRQFCFMCIVQALTLFAAKVVRFSLAQEPLTLFSSSFMSLMRPICCTLVVVVHEGQSTTRNAFQRARAQPCKSFSIPPIVMLLMTVYSSIPYFDPSLPNPDSFTPPNGLAASEMSPVLTPIMPTSSASATR